MAMRALIDRISRQEDINFLLTNRIPRALATRLMGYVSRIEHPLVREVSIGLFRLFCDPDLSEAAKARFKSLHDCFIRELKAGTRPIDPDPAVLVSPCDAIVGTGGTISGVELLQIKGAPYTLADLFGDCELVELYRDGCYATLRLTAGMYHRFHAPYDARIESVTYISGDTWNVNPIALRRIEKLFCKNERALIRTRLAGTGHLVTLVPVAAILVSGIRLHVLGGSRDLKACGRRSIACDTPVRKGEELGWFEHGSTIIVFAPKGFALCAGPGGQIRMGQPLMRLPRAPPLPLARG
jgi:phosphatidylserine decarboxylase